VSYRRAESQSAAGRIRDHLRLNGFEPDGVFSSDMDGLPPGVDPRNAISETLSRCDVVLVVIGPSWLGAVDTEEGRPRGNPEDIHRFEVESALNSRLIVIPVLVEGAQHPAPGALPTGLEALAYRNAWALSDRQFAADATGLADHIRRLRSERSAPPTRESIATGSEPLAVATATKGHGRFWLAGVALLVVAVVALVIALSVGSDKQSESDITFVPTTSIEASSSTTPATSTSASAPDTAPPETAQTRSTTGTTVGPRPSPAELPDRFAAYVPSDECSSLAVERDTGSVASVRRCVGPWTVSSNGTSEVNVYRWDGEKWTDRGRRSLLCAADFVSVGMSTFDAATFGARTKEGRSCDFGVNYFPEPGSGPLRRGHQGPRVEQLQIRLANLGLLQASIDDKFGLNTSAAVVDLKLLLGIDTLDTVDSVATDQVLALLD